MLKITNFEAGERGDLCGYAYFFSVITAKNVNILDFGDYN